VGLGSVRLVQITLQSCPVSFGHMNIPIADPNDICNSNGNKVTDDKECLVLSQSLRKKCGTDQNQLHDDH